MLVSSHFFVEFKTSYNKENNADKLLPFLKIVHFSSDNQRKKGLDGNIYMVFASITSFKVQYNFPLRDSLSNLLIAQTYILFEYF